MLNRQRLELEHAGVTFRAENSEVHFGFGGPNRMELECPCELRAGKYEVDRLGAFSYLGGGDTIVRHVSSIGRFCSIGPNLFAGPAEHWSHALCPHPIFEGNWRGKWPEVDEYYSENAEMIDRAKMMHDNEYGSASPKITIGNSVWIGEGVFIRRGVRIGDGATVAARSIVLNDVEPYSVVAGSPARVVKTRWNQHYVDRLLQLKWWDYGLPALDGVNMTLAGIYEAEKLVGQISDNIHKKKLSPMRPKVVVVEKDGSCGMKE